MSSYYGDLLYRKYALGKKCKLLSMLLTSKKDTLFLGCSFHNGLE